MSKRLLLNIDRKYIEPAGLVALLHLPLLLFLVVSVLLIPFIDYTLFWRRTQFKD